MLAIDSPKRFKPSGDHKRYIVFPAGSRTVDWETYSPHVDTVHLDILEFLDMVTARRAGEMRAVAAAAIPKEREARPSLLHRMAVGSSL